MARNLLESFKISTACPHFALSQEGHSWVYNRRRLALQVCSADLIGSWNTVLHSKPQNISWSLSNKILHLTSPFTILLCVCMCVGCVCVCVKI